MFFGQRIKTNGTKARIMLYGDIGTGFWDEVNTDDIAKELNVLTHIDEIEIRINSRGGSVFAGVALYSYLKSHKAKKIIHIDGLCASIATVIAMAGDEIIMSNSAQFMIHNPWAIAQGEKKDLEKKAKVLDSIKESIINAYMTKSTLSKEEISKAMGETTYYTAEQAKECGFITSISNEFEPKNLLSDNELDMSYKNLNNTEQIKGEEEKMTKEQLKNQHPDLYNEIVNEGRTEERARIQNLDTIKVNNKEASEIINKAKYEEPKNAHEIALEILNMMNTTPQQADPFENRAKDAEPMNNIGGAGDVLPLEEADKNIANDLATELNKEDF